MGKPVRVPIRVKQENSGSSQEEKEMRAPVAEPEPAVTEREPPAVAPSEEVHPEAREKKATSSESRKKDESLREDLETWRDRALRLQAEIENFRKRQRRLAQDRVEENRARLLRKFLMIADDLERALNAEDGDGASVREGVGVTQRSLRQLLKQEGVERVEAKGEAFDPNWHEAVGTVPHEDVDVGPDTIVDVTQQGYRLNGRLLRPARVIVAK